MEQQIEYNRIDSIVFNELCNTIGKENISENSGERVCFTFDSKKEKSLPDLVVRPNSTEQVSKIVSTANKHSIPICPYRNGIDLPGKVASIKGGIYLDMKNMNKIEEINARDLTVTVEPGVVIKKLQNEVEKFRLFYPPGLGSNGHPTIGRDVEECTGGKTGMKYGVTRDYVLALEIVLPDGSVINTGRKTLKSVAGYDLTRFFVGSEGTLGIMTKITLKLLPIPEKRGTIMSFFKDIDSALNTTDSILIKNHLHPCSLVFADKICIDAVSGSIDERIPEEADALLLIEVDGNEKNVEIDMSRISALCNENGVLKSSIVNSNEERKKLWDIGTSVFQSPLKVASMKYDEDFCVPRSKVREVLKKAYELSRIYSFQVGVFGHIGEGHIHLNVLYNNGEENDMSVTNLVSQMLNDVVPIGGSIKSELVPHEIEIMKDLKNMFDPEGIMNPCKIFV